MLVTNQPQMVEAARISYRDYPTAVNAIGQSNKTYKNKMSEYAKMDSMANKAQMGIGLSSNLAQLALSYLWTKRAKGEIDDEYQELYHNCIILATLAQLLIDGIKRSFEVDAMSEVDRIQSLPSMKRLKTVEIDGKTITYKCDFPRFMKYIKEIPLTKNGLDIPQEFIKKRRDAIEMRIDDSIICPMNWMEEALSEIPMAKRGPKIDTLEYFIRITGQADARQMGKVRKIVEEYDAWTKAHVHSNSYVYNNDNESDTTWVTKQLQ